MRWDRRPSSRTPKAASRATEEAVVRRFDAPEALNTRFHEVHAKSALNKVPVQASVPFRWTVNPYRGCTHACVYCLLGSTRAHGRRHERRSRPAVGDEIIGTEREALPALRAHARARPLVDDQAGLGGQRSRTAPAPGQRRSPLPDRAGWKHVEAGAGGRPSHLTTNNELRHGHFAEPPRQNEDYKRGYLCGLIRGDGHLAHTSTAPGRPHRACNASGSRWPTSRRCGVREVPRLVRCGHAGVRVRGGRRRSTRRDPLGARSTRADHRLIRFPYTPRRLAQGLSRRHLRRRGSCGRGCGSRTPTGSSTGRGRLGCSVRHRRRGRRPPNGCASSGSGGLKERLRFFHTVDPAITRKRSIEGSR